MELHEWIRVLPMATGGIAPIDEGDVHIGVIDQRVGKGHAHRAGADDEIVRVQGHSVATMPEHEHQTQAAEWDARYEEREGSMWSGRPNGRLVAEVADLDPGRALDVG